MPEYQYHALGGDGRAFSGVVVASSLQQARKDLESSRVFLVKIKPLKTVSLGRKKTKETELKDFAEELIALLSSGIRLISALSILSDERQNTELVRHLREVASSVEKGEGFYESCARYPSVFSEDFLRAIKAGERQSNLVDALNAYRELITKRLQVRRSIRQALSYPIFLLVTVAVAILVLFIFVVPKFETMLQGFGSDLPAITRAVIAISEVLPMAILFLATSTIGAMSILRRFEDSGLIKRTLGRLAYSVPVYGNIRRYSDLIGFYGMLASFIYAGIPVASALKEVASAFRSGEIGRALHIVVKEVTNGASLGEAMAVSSFFSGRDLKLIEIGEQSGNLNNVFEGLGGRYKERLDSLIARFTSLIEPIIMLLIGLLVGTVVIAMYMPVFMMAEVV